MNYNYTDEILLQIRDAAAIGATLIDLATTLGLQLDLFLADYWAHDSSVRAYYDGGSQQGREAVRQKVHTLAQSGSLQAVQQYESEMRVQERRNFLKHMRQL